MAEFVGIGLGAVQAGLYLARAEAAEMGRAVILRRHEQADCIRRAGFIDVNVAAAESLQWKRIHRVEPLLVTDPACVNHLAAATEIAVAVNSVGDYAGIAPLLAAATRRKSRQGLPPCIIYASENHLAAAHLLRAAIEAEDGVPDRFQTVDTVIGKMSKTIKGEDEITAAGLRRCCPGLSEAWLVEAYDELHIGRIADTGTYVHRLPGVTMHDDLQPMAAAKLYGHNAAHATFAYAGLALNLPLIRDVVALDSIMQLVRQAMLEETGVALRQRFGNGNPLFSGKGWTDYTDSLFNRMANPNLGDSCERVGRDAGRKLGWHDRLIGTIRFVEEAGVPAHSWKIAACCACHASDWNTRRLAAKWRLDGATPEAADNMSLVLEQCRPHCRRWLRSAFQFPAPKL